MSKHLFVAIIFFLLSVNLFAQRDSIVSVRYCTPLPDIHIRALDVMNDSTVWFAANRGIWGFTSDAGKTWKFDFIKADSVYPEFRSIAVLNDSTVLLLNVASPASIFKTCNKGKTWTRKYTNTDKNIFFDSMKFSDSNNGFAIADPIAGCFQLIYTHDGGDTWKQDNCTSIPSATEGEALFAASNTNLDIFNNYVWFATGGKRARVFLSEDGRKHFQAFHTPLAQGNKMTGIFSIDFFDERTGIITGGDYEHTDSSVISMAITHNSGRTWEIVKNKKPFFGSCVQLKSADTFFVTGHNGTYMANSKTLPLIELQDQYGAELAFHTLRFSPTHKVLCLAGDKGRIAFITFSP